MSHQQLNANVNNLVGNTPNAHPLLRILTSQGRIIKQEAEELMAAILAKDITEVRDGLSDVIVTTDGMYHRLGIEGADLEEVAKGAADVSAVYSGKSASSLLSIVLEQINAQINFLAVVGGLTQDQLDGMAFKSHTSTKEQANEAWIKDTIASCDSLRRSAYLLSSMFGVDIAADQQAVYESNMSKFDTDRSVAEEGVGRYWRTVGVEVEIFPNTINDVEYFVLKSARDQKGTDGKDYPAGKFLKSSNFFEPRFQPLPEDAPIFEILASK